MRGHGVSNRTARWLIIVASGFIGGLAIAVLLNWDTVAPYLKTHDAALRLLGTILAPFLALLGFVWSRLDKAELAAQAESLGQARHAAATAERQARAHAIAVDETLIDLDEREERIAELEADIVRLTENAGRIWRIRPPRVFDTFYEWRAKSSGARIIALANPKGDAGKTTLAANLAAYISETRRRPVLTIDLDHQATLSSSLMLAAGLETVGSNVEQIFAPSADLVTLERAKIHLSTVLPRAWLVPAGLSFNEFDNRLLLQAVLADETIDVRYRLAHLLLRPDVRERYEAIILDLPSRLTLGAVNGIVASDAIVVPTTLDKSSAEAFTQFLGEMKEIKADMGLDFELAGIVPTMTQRHAGHSARERQALELIREAANDWRTDGTDVITKELPYRASIASMPGEGLAYFGKDSQGRPLRELFDPIFEQILARAGIETPSADVAAVTRIGAR